MKLCSHVSGQEIKIKVEVGGGGWGGGGQCKGGGQKFNSVHGEAKINVLALKRKESRNSPNTN